MLLLKDVPDNLLEVAFVKCLQTCKMPPTPADVLEQVKAVQTAAEPTDEEMWSVFTKALRVVATQVYRIKYPLYGEDPRQIIADTWEGLPERLQMYIGSEGELMRMSNYSDDDLRYEKSRFLKTMPTIAARQEYKELSMLIEGGAGLFLEQNKR